jgi:hypothetical protein
MFDSAWLAAFAALIGTAANANGKRWGFIIWLFANAFWRPHNWLPGQYPQALQYLAYFFLALWGWIQWSEKKKASKSEPAETQTNEAAELPWGIKVYAETYGGDYLSKSVDVMIEYPDGVKKTLCGADYCKVTDILYLFAYEPDERKRPRCTEYHIDLRETCPRFVPEADAPYPLCDNPKCRVSKSCDLSAHCEYDWGAE